MKIINGRKLRVGFTCSAFDLCHAGHSIMLEEAKTQCDYLIVGLQTDPTLDRSTKNHPVQDVVERQILLRANKFVDEIIVYTTESELEKILRALPIDVRILGDEYRAKEFTGRSICVERDIEIYFNSRNHSFSTTELRKRVWAAEEEKKRKAEAPLSVEFASVNKIAK